jgi:hypothetical protein
LAMGYCIILEYDTYEQFRLNRNFKLTKFDILKFNCIWMIIIA